MRTFAQSASSSSATISGSEVIEPCPISVAADMMVVVPSGAMLTHGLNSWPTRSAAGTAASARPRKAMANERPAAPIMTWRRDSGAVRLAFVMYVMALALPRGALDRAHDPLVRSAAADIGVHVLDDLVARWFWRLLQKRSRAHDLAGLAIAALRHPLGEPGLLHRMRGVGRKALDRGHRAPGHFRNLGLAGKRPLAVDMHHAGAAQPGAAAEFGAGEFELLAG